MSEITANSGISTIIAALDTSFGLAKQGVGTINLQGANVYDGPTTVFAGSLDVSGASERNSDSSDVTIDSGASMRFFLGASTETIGSLTGEGNLVFGNSDAGGTTLVVGGNGINTTFSGDIVEQFGGTGRLVKESIGNLTLAGNNSYTGGTTVGDFGSLIVNTNSLPAADYAVWRNNLGATAGTLPNDTAGGTIGPAQYATWKSNFGTSAPGSLRNASAAVPEPATLVLMGLMMLVGLVPRR